jgi:transposase
MLRIEHVQDIDTLRQMALLLKRENQRLMDRIKKLTLEMSQLKGQDASTAQQELALLQELLDRRNHALFGDSSEKRRSRPTNGDSEGRAPQRGHGPKAQPELPIVERVHELDEADRTCDACGGVMDEMGDQVEESEEVTVVERQFVLVKQRRKKYRCKCNGCVKTAPAPPKVKPGSRYSPEFAVEVATSKYLDHLPLERQCRIMCREGLQINSQTLWDQIESLAGLLRPTYRSLREWVLASPLVHADETYWRLMKKGTTKRWWVWATACSNAVVYRILDSRSTEAAAQVLPGYDGIVMADGYGAYKKLSRDGPSFTLVHCWAHVRRKFVEIEEHYPEECASILEFIRKLYEIEGMARGDSEEVVGLRVKFRDEQSRPLIRKIYDWALEQRPLPRSGLGQAIRYMLGIWPGLKAFLDDPRIPLDNNHAERGLRGVVVGRKNHYGSRSKRGTEVAALFYSLFESAKLAGVEPKTYLLKATHAAIANRKTATLPHELLN